MKLNLAPFSLAFALPADASGLGTAEEEKLRLTTGGYLQHKLKLLYPAFQGLNLAFVSFRNQVGDPHAKFHICLEAKVAVFFDNGADHPDKNDVLTTLLSQLDGGYLSVIRRAFDDTSSLASALEVQAQRLEADRTAGKAMATDGRVPVTMSDVYVAFAMPDCHVQPSYKDYKALVKTTSDFFSSHLKKKFETFRGINVSVRRTIFGEGMPIDDHNVYVEWELVMDFVPSELGTVPGKYWLGMELMGADLDRYYKKHVTTLAGTPFAGAANISIGHVEDN